MPIVRATKTRLGIGNFPTAFWFMLYASIRYGDLQQNTFRILSLIAVLVLTTSCARNYEWRGTLSDNGPCVAESSQDCPEHVLLSRVSEAYPDVSVPMGVIEFDDMGTLMNRGHKDRLMNYIRSIADDREIMLIVFAHGWKHNAAPDNNNLRDFQDLLLKVSAGEQERCRLSGCTAHQVFGVYLGWRGTSVRVPGLKELSFWNRKKRAQRIGQDGATEIVSELRRIQKPEGKNNLDHRFIAIGHSFGGALLYNATQQLIQHNMSFRIHNDVPRRFADIIILVNPAFEAARLSALHERSLTQRFDNSQRVLLAIFTSRKDRATKWYFPVGRHLSTIWTAYRNGREEEQKELDVRAVGHYDPYITHELHVTDPDADDKGYGNAVCDWYEYKDGKKDAWDLQNGVELKRADWIANDALRNTPLLNVRVTDDLVAGHSSIWGDRFRDSLYRLIAVQDSGRC